MAFAAAASGDARSAAHLRGARGHRVRRGEGGDLHALQGEGSPAHQEARCAKRSRCTLAHPRCAVPYLQAHAANSDLANELAPSAFRLLNITTFC